MELKKYCSNAISEETPSYFKCSYIEIKKSQHHNIGKRIFPHSALANILTQKSEKLSPIKVRYQLKTDQDLDSLKLSVQPDITKGYRNAIRYHSNHHKSFFEKIETQGYRRLTTEITSIAKMPKITRTFKVESSKRVKPAVFRSERNELKQKYSSNELNLMCGMNPAKTKKKNLPKADLLLLDELEVFEKKLKEQSATKNKMFYQIY